MKEDAELLLEVSAELREKIGKEIDVALQDIREATADYGGKWEDLRWKKTNNAYLGSLCSNTAQADKLRNDIKEYDEVLANKGSTFGGYLKSLYYRLFDGGIERKKIAVSYFELNEKMQTLNVNMNKSKFPLHEAGAFIPHVGAKSIEGLLMALQKFSGILKKLNKDFGVQNKFLRAYKKLDVVFNTYYKNKTSVEVSPQLMKNAETLAELENDIQEIIQRETVKAFSALQNPAQATTASGQQSQSDAPFFLEAQRGREAGQTGEVVDEKVNDVVRQPGK